VVAVDFEDAETGKIEAGSGIESAFPRAVFSTTWASLKCEGGRFNSDSGGIDSVDEADDTGEVGGKELEERRDMCSGADGVTAAIDMSSHRGEWGTGGCDTMVVGVRGTCDSGMEVGLERGELGIGSAMNSDDDNIEQSVERPSRAFAHAHVSGLPARGSSPTLSSTSSYSPLPPTCPPPASSPAGRPSNTRKDPSRSEGIHGTVGSACAGSLSFLLRLLLRALRKLDSPRVLERDRTPVGIEGRKLALLLPLASGTLAGATRMAS
jgi:hypothetical protein